MPPVGLFCALNHEASLNIFLKWKSFVKRVKDSVVQFSQGGMWGGIQNTVRIGSVVSLGFSTPEFNLLTGTINYGLDACCFAPLRLDLQSSLSLCLSLVQLPAPKLRM